MDYYYDVVIVGAGPAGTTAGYVLARQGLRVVVIDKKKFPRFKSCGGLLTQKSIRLLTDVFGVKYNDLFLNGIIQYKSRRYEIRNPNGMLVNGSLEYPFHFIDRYDYDTFLVNRAAMSGANMRLGEKVTTLCVDQNYVVTRSGDRYFGKFIIGADGVGSRCRKEIQSFAKNKNRTGSGMASTLEIKVTRKDFPWLKEYPIIYFGYNRWGYAWSFPGKTHHILGMCGLNHKADAELKSRFLLFLKDQSIPVTHELKMVGYPLPYGNYMTRPGLKNILLSGDAAGMVEPLLGEGIYYAQKSGQLAAFAVMDSLRTSSAAIVKYQRYLSDSILIEMSYSKRWRNIMYSALNIFDYKLMAFFFKLKPKAVEQTILGLRSFKFFRHLP